MRTLALIIMIVGMMSINAQSKSSHKKLRHQNRIFQRHLQCSERSTIAMNQSFKPRGQSMFPKVNMPTLYARNKHAKTKKSTSSNTYTSTL